MLLVMVTREVIKLCNFVDTKLNHLHFKMFFAFTSFRAISIFLNFSSHLY